MVGFVGADDVDLAQNSPRAHGDVLEIADGRCDHIEPPAAVHRMAVIPAITAVEGIVAFIEGSFVEIDHNHVMPDVAT